MIKEPLLKAMCESLASSCTFNSATILNEYYRWYSFDLIMDAIQFAQINQITVLSVAIGAYLRSSKSTKVAHYQERVLESI